MDNGSSHYAEKTACGVVRIAHFGTDFLEIAGRCSGAKIQPDDGCLVVEDDSEKGTMNSQSIVVVKEVQLLELVQKDCSALFGGICLVSIGS